MERNLTREDKLNYFENIKIENNLKKKNLYNINVKR